MSNHAMVSASQFDPAQLTFRDLICHYGTGRVIHIDGRGASKQIQYRFGIQTEIGDFCLTLCTNKLEADDLYQDTWLQVVKNFSRYDTSREFEPWLTQICVNLYRNALRRLSRSPFLSFRSNEEKDYLLCSIPAPEQKQITVHSTRQLITCRKSIVWP